MLDKRTISRRNARTRENGDANSSNLKGTQSIILTPWSFHFAYMERPNIFVWIARAIFAHSFEFSCVMKSDLYNSVNNIHSFNAGHYLDASGIVVTHFDLWVCAVEPKRNHSCFFELWNDTHKLGFGHSRECNFSICNQGLSNEATLPQFV